jgi:hypothetical protein
MPKSSLVRKEVYRGLVIFPRVQGGPGAMRAAGYEVRFPDGHPRFDKVVLRTKHTTYEEAYQAVVTAAHDRIDIELEKAEMAAFK